MKTIHVTKASTIWQSMIGLIGAKKPYPLLLQTRFGIHTVGVRFPLDILILDDHHKVMCLRQHLLPNRFYFWPPKWQWVLELPAGFISKHHIALGDHVKLS